MVVPPRIDAPPPIATLPAGQSAVITADVLVAGALLRVITSSPLRPGAPWGPSGPTGRVLGRRSHGARRPGCGTTEGCTEGAHQMRGTRRATPPDPGQPAESAPLLSTDETGCTEIVYPRGGSAERVRALVPARFELVPFPAPPGQPDRVSLFISEVTCRGVATATPQRHNRQRDVAYIIVSAELARIDGQLADGVYVLFHATENRTLHRVLNNLGWPTDLLERRSGIDITTTPGGLTRATGTFAGSGWDHLVTFASVSPFDQPESGPGIFYRDTATRQLRQCFDNTIRKVFGGVSGDLTTTPFASVTAVPPVFASFTGTPTAGTFLYTGSWRSTLTDQNCPSPTQN